MGLFKDAFSDEPPTRGDVMHLQGEIKRLTAKCEAAELQVEELQKRLKVGAQQIDGLLFAAEDANRQNEAMREALQTVLRELQNHGNIGDDELCRMVNGALSGATAKRTCEHKNKAAYHGLPGALHCSDCGGRIS